ncbi:MAG: hypothetical protein K9G64_05495, partial [Bacteroidia bacterium]|nr:hypothetical protein [Bacteroidia bacterium]
MKNLKLKYLFVLLSLSNLLLAQSDDRFYSAPKSNQTKKELLVSRKDTAKNKTASEISIAIGTTITNDGTVNYNIKNTFYNILDTSFSTYSNGPGFYLHFGIQIPIKNDFYFVIRQQIQSETSRSLVFEKETDFQTLSYLSNLGLEKRFKGFYVGADLTAGLAIVQNTQNEAIIGTNNNFTKSLIGLNANLGYQFNNGIRLGYSYRFSGETKYVYSYDYTGMFGTIDFSSVNSSYSSSLSTFFIGYNIKLKDTKKKGQTNIYNNNINSNIPLAPVVINYANYSIEELNRMLANATKDERYNDANNIQIELDKRKVLNKYANFNNEELKTKLETAIKDENYAEAEIIQKEIDKRTKLNKTEKNDSNKQGNQPAKKTLKELESDLKNAMDVEDYKKA